MEFAVLQDRLKEALSIVTKAVDPRPPLPILANVLVRATDGRIELVASNLEQTISVFVGARVDVPGAVTLPAKTLAELVSILAPERVDMSLNEGTQTVSLKCGSTKSAIKGMSALEFPPLPEPVEWQFSLPAEQLGKMIRSAAICVAKSDSRPILTGIYMRLEKERFELASSDGYRLAHIRTEIDSALEFTHVVPGEALKDFARLLKGDDAVELAFHNDKAFFRFGVVTVVIQLLEGKFPDFESIIPYHWNTRATCYKADLMRACKRAEIFGRDSGNRVRLMVKQGSGANAPGALTLVGKSAERGAAEAELDALVEGVGLDSAYNVHFLMDVLSAIDAERVVFDTDGAAHPATLAPDGESDTHFVIMPMSVNR